MRGRPKTRGLECHFKSSGSQHINPLFGQQLVQLTCISWNSVSEEAVSYVCLCSWNLSIYLKSSDPHREFWLSLESGGRGRKAWCCFIFTLPCSIQEKSGYKGRSWAGMWVKMGEGGWEPPVSEVTESHWLVCLSSNPPRQASLFKKCLIDGDSSKVLSN